MAIANFFVEPGVFSQFKPTTTLPVIPGGIRTVALIGTGRQTILVKGEEVTKGSADSVDNLGKVAVSLESTITDEDFKIYSLGVDYQLTGGDVDWSLNGAAAITGIVVGPYVGLSGKTFKASVNGGSEQSVSFTTETTATDVATTISTLTGITATVVGGAVKVSSDSINNASLLIGTGTANATLGFTDGSFVQGPREPVVGKKYFVNYEYAKASADYAPKFYFNMADVENDFGGVSTSNTLSLGAEIVFQQGTSAVCLAQTDPADGAVVTQFQKALDKLLQVKGINIVVPLSTNTSLFASVKTHVTVASSLTERKERIAILGLSGSPSVATVVSQAQGLADKRISLVYPTSCTRFVGSGIEPSTLDGSFLAAAVAGVRSSVAFDVAEPLTRKEVAGFVEIPDTLLRSEKNQLSGNGVMVIESVSAIPRVRFGTTTNPATVDTREISVVEIIDFVGSSMRELLEAIFIGQKILAETPSQVRSTITAVLNDLIRREIIVAFDAVQASVDGLDPTQINVSFKVSPVFPLNFILITFSLEV